MLELVDQMNRLLNTESVTPSSGDARVPPESQVTDGPPPAGTDLIQKLKNASAAGQLSRVQCLLKKWRSLPNRKTTRDPSRAMVPLQSVLYAAVRKNRSSVVCFLLDEGFVLDFQSVAIAVKGRFVEILQVFLDYGWDINEIQGPRMAPALSYVLWCTLGGHADRSLDARWKMSSSWNGFLLTARIQIPRLSAGHHPWKWRPIAHRSRSSSC